MCFFSPNTNANSRSKVSQQLHTDTEALSDKYLGLLAMVGAERSDCFKYCIERIKQRMQGRMEKQLPVGGKEIMLKVVA